MDFEVFILESGWSDVSFRLVSFTALLFHAPMQKPSFALFQRIEFLKRTALEIVNCSRDRKIYKCVPPENRVDDSQVGTSVSRKLASGSS